jgi:hypothetical protein
MVQQVDGGLDAIVFQETCFRDIWGEVKPIDGFLKIQELWLCFKGLLFTAGQVECMPRFVTSQGRGSGSRLDPIGRPGISFLREPASQKKAGLNRLGLTKLFTKTHKTTTQQCLKFLKTNNVVEKHLLYPSRKGSYFCDFFNTIYS